MSSRFPPSSSLAQHETCFLCHPANRLRPPPSRRTPYIPQQSSSAPSSASPPPVSPKPNKPNRAFPQLLSQDQPCHVSALPTAFPCLPADSYTPHQNLVARPPSLLPQTHAQQTLLPLDDPHQTAFATVPFVCCTHCFPSLSPFPRPVFLPRRRKRDYDTALPTRPNSHSCDSIVTHTSSVPFLARFPTFPSKLSFSPPRPSCPPLTHTRKVKEATRIDPLRYAPSPFCPSSLSSL